MASRIIDSLPIRELYLAGVGHQQEEPFYPIEVLYNISSYLEFLIMLTLSCMVGGRYRGGAYISLKLGVVCD
jgi:hypothetical protein